MTKTELLSLAASAIAAAQAVADAIGALPDDPVVPPPEPPPTPPEADIAVSPASVEEGNSATLSWMTTGAESVTLNGEQQTFVGSLEIVAPVGQHTFTLVATGPGGTVTASATLTVTEAPVEPPPVPTDEHEAAMTLVPASEASLFVPTGEAAELSGTQAHGGIRVEGTLRMLPGLNLTVDTLLTAHGTLEIGTPTNPVTLANPVHITIRDVPLTDPFHLGRGVVLHGPVTIHGEPGAVVIESASTVNRGHFMVMGGGAVDIDGLTLRNMGRTRKDIPVTDLPDTSNLRGRYPLHFHHHRGTVPAKARNIRVEGSLGWGVVNHDSWVECDDSVVVDTFGAAFVAEVGTEAGHFRNCRAENIDGIPGHNVGDGSGALQDWAKGGHFIWLQGGGNVLIEGGSYANVRSKAVVVMGTDSILIPREAIVDAELQPALSYTGDVSSLSIPFRVRGVTFSGGDSLGIAFEPWINQNPLRPDQNPLLRAELSDCTFNQCGLLSVYSNQTDHLRNVFNGTPSAPSGTAMGHTGIVISHKYIDQQVRGYQIGMNAPTDDVNLISGGAMANIVDIAVCNRPWASVPRTLTIENVTFEPLEAGVDPNLYTPSFSGPGIPPGRWHVAMVMFYPYADIRYFQTLPEGHEWWPNWFHWRDTFGPADVVTLNGEHLAYNEWGWDYPVPPFVPAQYRLKPDGTTKTQGELYVERGWCPCGRVPVQGERRENIWGIVSPTPVVVVADPPVPE